MGRRNLMILVPVILLLFVNDGVKGTAEKNVTKGDKNGTITKLPTTSPFKTSQNVTLTSSQPLYTRPVKLGPMVKRLAIVALALSLIVALYFVWKLCGTRKRKARKYGVIKTPGDVELRPLESDDEDDDDDDVTMFNRKN